MLGISFTEPANYPLFDIVSFPEKASGRKQHCITRRLL